MLLHTFIIITDEFISSVTREKDEKERRTAEEENKKKIAGLLDPLTRTLTTFEDEDDLVEGLGFRV